MVLLLGLTCTLISYSIIELHGIHATNFFFVTLFDVSVEESFLNYCIIHVAFGFRIEIAQNVLYPFINPHLSLFLYYNICSDFCLIENTKRR